MLRLAIHVLAQTVETQAHRSEVERRHLLDNPNLKPSPPFDPLQWIASYLVQHNEQHLP